MGTMLDWIRVGEDMKMHDRSKIDWSGGMDVSSNDTGSGLDWGKAVDDIDIQCVIDSWRWRNRKAYRRRVSYQADAASSQSADVRRETMVLNRPEIAPTNMPVIFDEGNDDDDDDFLPVSSKTFVKQDTQDKSDITWDDLYNFDADEGDQGESTEIIYYPPSESDGSDTLASSYQVFDAGLSSERRRSQFKHSISINSNADGDSETTDPVSLDDIDDDDDSNNSVPTTPMDEPPKSQNREKFLKDTFENLSFTPSETDKFVKGLETLEEEMDSVPAGMITSRQSLSARFLSKSQAVRGMGPCGNIQRQDNWYDSVQRGKDNMARNLDESRKMLMAMGWKQESPEADGDDPFVDSHKPPTSPKHVTPKQNQEKSSMKSSDPSDDSTINPALNIRDHQPTPPTSSAGVSSKSSDQHHTPTSSRRSLSSSSSRPRTLPLDRSGGRLTPTDKSTNKMTVKSGTTTRKDTPTGSQQSNRLSEYKKNTRLSTPNLGKVQMVSPEPRRSSSGSNLAKSKSNSMHNLTFEDDELELTPRGTNRKSRSKWSTPKMSSFASVPNLLNPDDDGKLSVVSFDDNKQDINDNVLKEKKSTKPASKKSPQVGSRGDSDVRLTRRAASTSRLQSEEKKSLSRKVGMSATNLRSLDNKSKDRDLMPPPAFTSVAKKQESRFMKRAQQPRRKTTGGSELTFEEAKNILKGNSGILNGKGEKEKRSSSISPSRNISRAVKSIDNDDVVSKSDLSNNITDSEMSSVESRKSSSSSILSLGNKLDQFEALDGDTSSECDTHKTRGRPSKSPTRVSVKPILAKDRNNESMNNDYKDSFRDSGVSTQDEEDCPSPSVKERIARLNKHAGSSEKLHPHSLLRDQNRAESPEPNSSRQTSTVQISLNTSVVSTSSSASVAMATIADSMTTIGSSVSPLRGTDSFQSSVQTLSDNNHTLHQNIGTSPSSLSNPNLSPPSGMGTSLDSEGLSHHLSPGNQSNGSPRSVADTGLGSDTDLENSQTFRRGQFNGPGDSHSMVEKLDQMLVLMNQISIQHKQMQENPVNGYAEVMTQCDQRFSSLCESYCETFGKSLYSITGKDEIIKEALDELQRNMQKNMQKVKDLVNS